MERGRQLHRIPAQSDDSRPLTRRFDRNGEALDPRSERPHLEGHAQTLDRTLVEDELIAIWHRERHQRVRPRRKRLSGERDRRIGAKLGGLVCSGAPERVAEHAVRPEDTASTGGRSAVVHPELHATNHRQHGIPR